MDLVGKPNNTSPIWSHLHSCHPSVFVQVFSSSRNRKRTAGQVCIGEDFSKLAKYKRDSIKWKMQTKNVETYAAIATPQRAREDERVHLVAEQTVKRVYTRGAGTGGAAAPPVFFCGQL